MNAVMEKLDQIAAQAQRMADNNAQFQIEMARQWERLRGVKIVRFPVNVIQATAATPLTVLPEQMPNAVGPDSGFVWSLKLLVIEGLATGATPDVINFTSRGRIIWQLNGNSFAQDWGKGSQILFPGELLGIASVGNMTNTGKVIVHGHAWEVPGPEIGKLL